MFGRVLVGQSSRILLSGRRLIAKPSTWSRCWSVLSATTRTVSQKPYAGALCACSKVCACGLHKITQADQDLLGFLADEINFEKDSAHHVPSLELFSARSDGTLITLEREINGERVAVTFDIDQNINEDQSYDSEDESGNSTSSNMEKIEGNIVSYPSFTVDIIKTNGKTLHFSCEYHQQLLSEPKDDQGEDLFQIVHITVKSSPDEGSSKGLYTAETENLDPNLYSMLVKMLAERGVDSIFARKLLEYSTALEHQHYIRFLEDLQSFIKQN